MSLGNGTVVTSRAFDCMKRTHALLVRSGSSRALALVHVVPA